MFMTAAERVSPPSPTRPEQGRSPFVRLRELLGNAAAEVLGLNGSREGLFLAALAAKRWVSGRVGRPAVLLPNPFYGAYSAGAIAADCEPHYLPATRATGFLPDLDALPDELLGRT